MAQIDIKDESGDKMYFTVIPNYILNHSTLWDREVYIQMKRIAGEKGTCWTSQKKLAKQCGVSINRLKKSLSYLVDHEWIKLVGKKTVETSGGIQEVNEYKIIDLWNINNNFYQNHKGVSRNDTPIHKGVSRKSQRGVTSEPKGVSPGDDKEEPLKEEPIKEELPEQAPTEKNSTLISELIKEFETINPACKKMYGNKTQRKACNDLIEQYGFDEVSKVTIFLTKSNKIKYLPTITTPQQLWDKYQSLKDGLQKLKENKKQNNYVI